MKSGWAKDADAVFLIFCLLWSLRANLFHGCSLVNGNVFASPKPPFLWLILFITCSIHAPGIDLYMYITSILGMKKSLVCKFQLVAMPTLPSWGSLDTPNILDTGATRGGTPIWNRRGCSSQILNLTPKGDHLGIAHSSFLWPLKETNLGVT